MAYKTEGLLAQALKEIKDKKLFFIEDVITLLPCHKSTFYEHFPNDSDNYKRIFSELEKNRVDVKIALRSKWYKSNAPALQMALMKLICTDDERKKLAMQYSENENNHTIENFNIKDVITFKENVSDK